MIYNVICTDCDKVVGYTESNKKDMHTIDCKTAYGKRMHKCPDNPENKKDMPW